jgi:hypothetical protein
MSPTKKIDLPSFLKSLPKSPNAKASPSKFTTVKTHHALVRMATINPPNGNSQLTAVVFWFDMVDDSTPRKSCWQCKICFDDLVKKVKWTEQLELYERVYQLYLHNVQQVNIRGYPVHLYLRFCPISMSVAELREFAGFIADNINNHEKTEEHQKVLVAQDFLYERNTVWSSVLGLEQSMKHCSFFNDGFTSPA